MSFGKRSETGQLALASGQQALKRDASSVKSGSSGPLIRQPAATGRKWIAIGIVAAVAVAAALLAVQPHRSPNTAATGRMWVATSRLAEYSCPSSKCGILGRLHFGDAADVLEVKGSWGRVTPYHDALCQSRRSRQIYEGDASCTPANGVDAGKLAGWVEIQSLARARPDSP